MCVCTERQLDSLSLTTLREHTNQKVFFYVFTRFGDFWIKRKQNQKVFCLGWISLGGYQRDIFICFFFSSLDGQCQYQRICDSREYTSGLSVRFNSWLWSLNNSLIYASNISWKREREIERLDILVSVQSNTSWALTPICWSIFSTITNSMVNTICRRFLSILEKKTSNSLKHGRARKVLTYVWCFDIT